MNYRHCCSITGSVLLGIATLTIGDLITGHSRDHVLLLAPEIVTSAMAADDAFAGYASNMATAIKRGWPELAATQAYVVNYDGRRFQSRFARISEVAQSPGSLNLIATDYRCGFCKRDRAAVEQLIRNHPKQEFVFLEFAVLGPESVELAELALTEATRSPSEYYSIHYRYFDKDPPQHVTSTREASELVSKQVEVAKVIGVAVTPSYVIGGVPHVGPLTK